MECKALTDGLVDKTRYVHAGEVFETAKCPFWATPVKTPKKKQEAGAAASGEDKDVG